MLCSLVCLQALNGEIRTCGDLIKGRHSHVLCKQEGDDGVPQLAPQDCCRVTTLLCSSRLEVVQTSEVTTGTMSLLYCGVVAFKSYSMKQVIPTEHSSLSIVFKRWYVAIRISCNSSSCLSWHMRAAI